MRRVLILNYFFAPLGGAGAVRGATLVGRLPELGYEPVVVTGPGQSFGRFRPKDEAMAERVRNVEVHRITEPEPQPAGGRRALADRLLARAGAWQDWLERGLVEVGRRVENVDLIYADLGPDATAFAGVRLARERGLPLVLDLGDPWALDEMRVYLSALHRRRDAVRMRTAFRAADAVVLNTREAVHAAERALPEMRGRLLALPVGFDAQDFATPAASRTDDAFRIVHTGSFHTGLALAHARRARLRRVLGGGAALPVDVRTRTPSYLARAIARVRAAHPELARDIELHLAGPMTDADRTALGDLAGVHEHGFLGHAETLALMRSADLLFVPMQNLPRGSRARMVPSKTYEYLASGRPVLAAMADGDGRDLAVQAPACHVVRPADIEASAAVIAQEATRTQPAPSAALARADLLAPFERARLNGDLARAFDAVLGDPTGATQRPVLTGNTA